MADDQDAGYDPAKHLTTVSGQPYLPVAERLRWFRDESRDGDIDIQHIEISDQRAIFRATVTRIVDGVIQGRAVGYGSETPRDFGDYIEKASTKALGRALAALGYGTPFIGDELTGAAPRPVDAPVNRGQGAHGNGIRPSSYAPPPGGQGGQRQGGPTQRQRDFIGKLAQDIGWTIVGPDGKALADWDEINRQALAIVGKETVDALTVPETSQFIDELKAMANQNRPPAPAAPARAGNGRRAAGPPDDAPMPDEPPY